MLFNSLHILYAIMKTKQDFIKIASLFQNQIILSKKIFIFQKIFFLKKNGCKYGEEDANINGWDIYYRHLQEAQKSSQWIEDPKLHIEKIYGFDNEKKIFRRKNDGWEDEEEAHKDGRNLSFRDGMETW